MQMTNMTLAIPEDLYEIMQKHKEIKWSEVAREAIWDKAKKLEMMDSILSKSKKIIVVENNYSGQFARYLRSETSIVANGHIRKYDGEPFMPHHIVDGVKKILAGQTQKYVPVHEIMV